MQKHLTVVPRISDDETTFAVVQWEGDIGERDILKKITVAVTEWIDTTDKGRELWQDSCGDLNVGDLATYSDDSDLDIILTKHGIVNLDISTFQSEKDNNWTYDTVLVDEKALTSEGGVRGEKVENQVP